MKTAALADLLEKALEKVSEDIEKSGAVVNKPATMPTTKCEPEHLEFVFKCLIENAIKYCKPEKTAKIDITCVEKDKIMFC